MSIKSLVRVSSVLALASYVAVVSAEQRANPEAVVPTGSLNSPMYGTLHLSIRSVNAFDFVGAAPGDSIATNASGSRWVAFGSGFMDAPLSLPSGARIEWIQVQACDSSTTGQVTLALYSNTLAQFGEPIVQHGIVGTGILDTVGCDFVSLQLASPVTVDNALRSYFLEVGTIPLDGSVRIAAAKVFYRLQVSPSQGTALFNDVPMGHPFQQYIEALTASGVTGGCGGGNYCPDAPVTRGQMAVFLAVALGLHWPN